jgi:thiamine phosphate synthase YjbQ (UPF0047 family)
VRTARADGSCGRLVRRVTADVLLPALVSPSVTIPVHAGNLLLGTWQRVVVVDLNANNPNRHVRFSFLAG